MPIFADVAGHNILEDWCSVILLLFLVTGMVGGIVGWFCGHMYRKQRRR